MVCVCLFQFRHVFQMVGLDFDVQFSAKKMAREDGSVFCGETPGFFVVKPKSWKPSPIPAITRNAALPRWSIAKLKFYRNFSGSGELDRCHVRCSALHQHKADQIPVQAATGIRSQGIMKVNRLIVTSCTVFAGEVFLPALNWRRPGTNSLPWPVWTMPSRMQLVEFLVMFRCSRSQ